MSDIYVPGSDPEAFERSFVKQHPALGLKLTAGSGSKWGDGDARPEIIDRSMLQFSAEMKVRSGTPQHYRPVPSEWRKASDQLHKRNPGAVRLFVVYQRENEDYAVTIPRDDVGDVRWVLEVQGNINFGGHNPDVINCAGDVMQHYDYESWKKLYDQIREYRKRESNKS